MARERRWEIGRKRPRLVMCLDSRHVCRRSKGSLGHCIAAAGAIEAAASIASIEYGFCPWHIWSSKHRFSLSRTGKLSHAPCTRIVCYRTLLVLVVKTVVWFLDEQMPEYAQLMGLGGRTRSGVWDWFVLPCRYGFGGCRDGTSGPVPGISGQKLHCRSKKH